MADTTLSSPIATRTQALATTTQILTVPAEIAAGVQGLYLYCSTEVRYQIQADGRAIASGSTAPTVDYDVVPAATRTPIGMPGHVHGYAGDRVEIAIWAATGTPTLHIAPYPVSR